MQTRPFEITVKHAKNLKNVRHSEMLKMKVYAAVSLNGDRSTEMKTNVDENGGSNPIWNHDMQFIVEEAEDQWDRMVLVFRLFCERTCGDKKVGEVHVSITELLGTIGATGEVTRGIVTKSEMRGELTFSYELDEIDNFLATQPQPDGGNHHHPGQLRSLVSLSHISPVDPGFVGKMQTRPLEITVNHAKNLENIRHWEVLKLKVYAAVSLNGDRSTEMKTNVNEDGGSNPIWNHDMRFMAQWDRMVLVFRLFCKRTFDEKKVGEVHVPITELLGTIGATGEVTRGIVTKSEMRGELTFSYKLCEIDNFLATQPQPDGGNHHHPQQRQQGGSFVKATKWVGKVVTVCACVGSVIEAATGSNDD